MNKYITIICCLIMSFTINDIYAQQISGNIIDCTVIPYKARRTTPFSQGHNESSETNHLPNRFKVAKKDVLNGSNPKMYWSSANAACQSYTESGEYGWRLPTQREAAVLTLLRKNFNSNIVAPLSVIDYSDYYWCSTQSESQSGHYWSVCYTVNGLIGTALGTYMEFRARCVKDL